MPRIEESPGEPQIIHGLFPITPFATVQVEVAILHQGGLNQELERLRKENEAVLGYIGSISKQKSSSYILGAVLCYAVLRAEAQLRGGILPAISDDTIQAYIDYDLGIEQMEYPPERPSEELAAVWQQRRQQRFNTLLDQEPALRKTLESNYRNLPQDMYSSLINGIMDVYGIFYINAEFQEAHIRQPIADPVGDFVRREAFVI